MNILNECYRVKYENTEHFIVSHGRTITTAA